MPRLASALIAVAVLISGVGLAATPESIVAAFYPPSLATTVSGPVLPSERTYAYVVADLDGSGSQQIVAVYSNGINCAVRVLSSTGAGALVASAEPILMSCRRGEVELVDVNGSHHPLIVGTALQVRGLPTTWIFRWTGNALALVGPQRRPSTPWVASGLADTTFIDIDGTGTLSIIDRHTGLSSDDDGVLHASEENRIYRYVNGELQAGATADYFSGFVRAKGAPGEQRESFEISDPSRARQLIIVNGPGGAERVSAATITLNGQPIVQPSSFNQNVGIIRLAVTLQAKNDIRVRLEGKPGASIGLLVVPLQ